MRQSLLAAHRAALALAAPAAAGLPRAGTLVPGRSLGGIRLDETQHAVRAALGAVYGVCRRLRAADVVLHVQAVRRARARGRVRPAAASSGGLHALAAGGLARAERPPPRRDAARRCTSAPARSARSRAPATTRSSRDSPRPRTAYYLVDGRLWGFGLFRRSASPCR